MDKSLRSKVEKKAREKMEPIYIHATMILDADDETFRSYYTDSNSYKVFGGPEQMDRIWERAKKLSLR